MVENTENLKLVGVVTERDVCCGWRLMTTVLPKFASNGSAPSRRRWADLDTLVFAGGIGENAPTVRARICDGVGFLGIELEEKRNAANDGVISAAASRVAVRVIRTDEEHMIASTVRRALGLGMASE